MLHRGPHILREKVILDPAGTPWAALSDINILGPAAPLPGAEPPRQVLWSGWITDDSATHADPFTAPRDFRSWSRDAWARLESWCDAALPTLSRDNASILFRPHHRHILSDPQSCLTFLRRRESAPSPARVQLLLDPASFLSPDMLPRAEDHLARAMQLAHLPATAAILVTNLERRGEALIPSPLSRGQISERLLDSLISQAPSDKPLIILS